MRNAKKKAISLLISAMMISASAPAVYGQSVMPQSPTDVPLGHWASDSIAEWSANGIVNGYPDGTFQPNKGITRAEFVKMINQVFGFRERAGSNFSDVSAKAWYADQMAIAKAAGYYQGFPNNESKAAGLITRQDAVTLLARAFELASGGHANETFKDDADIQAYAKDAIGALAGIVDGYPDGTFRPNADITRAEAVSLIDKLVAGFYAEPSTIEGMTIQGNVVIRDKDVTLKNTTIEGNLYFAPGIENGDSDLDHVTVKGKTYVWGGGENTVEFRDSTLADVAIDRKDGNVRVLTSGSTRVNHIDMDSPSKLELGEGTKVDDVDVNGAAKLVVNEGASISDLTVHDGANGTTITGNGTITRGDIQASGVKVNGNPVAKGEVTVKGGKAESINSGSAGSSGSSGGTGSGATARVENFVDLGATAETKSLFAYLEDIGGAQVLFGHQHATDEGITITPGSADLQSEVYNSVGDYPAVFGWDTLSLEGKEKPGASGKTPAENRAALEDSMKRVYAKGGILALSAHMPNFVTGGSFNDTAGNVVQNILPGGSHHAEFNAFLDNIAAFASELKDANGKSIPVIFRPFHEQSGGWFWWGNKTTTTGQYQELYRYTVEYLRDAKHVHNFLYVYSPNGSFGGSADNYLTTYPGDEYVDILGMDQYDNKNNAGSQAFLNSIVADLAMISKLAVQKGKIPTFSEFGYSPEGLKVTGGDTQWFTKLLNAIKADPDARKIAYMQTWANFGYPNNMFVPYHNAPGGLGDHELLPDFIDFYDDPYSGFLSEVSGAYTKAVAAANETPAMHLVTPTINGEFGFDTTIRVRVLNADPGNTRIVFTAGSEPTEYPLAYDSASGYYVGQWNPRSEDVGQAVTIRAKATVSSNVVLEDAATVFVQNSMLKGLTFTDAAEADGGTVQNNGTWSGKANNSSSITTAFSHATLGGNGMLKIDVNGLVADDTWQELKMELKGNALAGVPLAEVNKATFDVLIPASAGSANVNATVRGIVQLPPDWDAKYGMTSTETKLGDLESVTIDGTDYKKFPVSIDLNNPAKSAEATGLAISIVGNGLAIDGSVYVDNIRLIHALVKAPEDPAIVDDFEAYQGSNDALGVKFVKANADPVALTLSTATKGSGTYGLKYDYQLGAAGYVGVTKTLAGVDWSAFNTLQMFYAPNGMGQKLVIQIKADGKYYEYYPDTSGTASGVLKMPLNQFVGVHGAVGGLSKTILKNVSEFSIYTNAVPGNSQLSGSFYFDDIKASADPASGTVPNGGSGPGSSAAQPGTLYDFESDAQGWVVEQNNASATLPSVTTDAAAEGSQALQSTFDLTKAGGFELVKAQAIDLTAVDAVSAKVKLSSGAANVRLYIKSGTGWTWYDGGVTVSADASGFKTITVPLSGATNRDMVQSIGIKIEPTSGLGNSTFYLDDVTLIGTPSGGGSTTAYDFESATDGWTINTDPDGSNLYNTASATGLNLTTEEHAGGAQALKAVFQLGPKDFQIRNMLNGADFDGATSLSAKVKVLPALGSNVSGVQAELFIQTGAGWSWASSGLMAIDENDFTLMNFDLSQVSELALVQAIGLKVLTPIGTSATVYVDDFAIADNNGALATYDFETTIDGFAVNTDPGGGNLYNSAGASGVSVTSSVYATGAKSLSVVYNSSDKRNFQLVKTLSAADYGAKSTITAKVKVVPASGSSLGSGVSAKLFIQTGSGWAYASSNEVAVDDQGFATLTFDISGIADRNSVQAIGVQVTSPSDSSGSATIYLDDVMIE